MLFLFGFDAWIPKVLMCCNVCSQGLVPSEWWYAPFCILASQHASLANLLAVRNVCLPLPFHQLAGEIVAMQGLMNMVFEVQDLAVASPATVSRCGMVYVQVRRAKYAFLTDARWEGSINMDHLSMELPKHLTQDSLLPQHIAACHTI